MKDVLDKETGDLVGIVIKKRGRPKGLTKPKTAVVRMRDMKLRKQKLLEQEKDARALLSQKMLNSLQKLNEFTNIQLVTELYDNIKTNEDELIHFSLKLIEELHLRLKNKLT